MNLLIPAIFLTVYAFSPKNETDIFWEKIWGFRKTIPLKILYLLNGIMLIVYIFGIDNSDLHFDTYLYRNTNRPFIAYAVKDYPYYNYDGLQYDFYKPKGVDITLLDSFEDVLTASKHENEIFVITHETKNNVISSTSDYSVEKIYSYDKNDLFMVIRAMILKNNLPVWTLYHVTPTPPTPRV
jgi:hypothetical protein